MKYKNLIKKLQYTRNLIESILKTMKPGDLVLPKEDYETLYPDVSSMYPNRSNEYFDVDLNQTFQLWHKNHLGVIVKISVPPVECSYKHVYILVGSKVGWTYSNFVRIIRENG